MEEDGAEAGSVSIHSFILQNLFVTTFHHELVMDRLSLHRPSDGYLDLSIQQTLKQSIPKTFKTSSPLIQTTLQSMLLTLAPTAF